MLHGTRNRDYAANRGFKKPSLATSVRQITEKMAAPTTDECMPASAREKRTNWTTRTTESLIRLWENHLRDLRSTSRNAKVYAAITAELNAELPPDADQFTPKQVRMKIDNLNKKYR